MKTTKNAAQPNSGYLLVLVLVFASVFLTITSSFIGFIVTQSRLITSKTQLEQSGQIAEAGLDYYKWFLAHYPDDTTNGTGLPGPYVGVYTDPEGGAIGEYSLTVASTTYCGDVAAIQITSEGHTYDNPSVTREIQAQYSRPTVAEFAYILNSNVWVGDDAQITGPYHSNGGIRMDGTNSSVVTSGQTSWSCDSSFGCSPTRSKNGVFTTTANANTALFEFPSAPINFSGITVDLANMQSKAQTGGGKYIGPSGRQGYYITFKSNGTFDVRRVNSKVNEPNGYAWGRYMHILNGTTLVGNYPIPSACPVIFVEDQVWVDGVINGKVTIAAADVDSSGVDRSMVLNGNITFASATSGLLAISEYDMIIPLVVPDDMTINGIFIAQNGAFTRNHYDTTLPNAWETYIKRNSLTVNGTIVSNLRAGTKWIDGGGTYISGFNNRYTSYSRDLVLAPPPLIPTTSDVYRFNDWRDQN